MPPRPAARPRSRVVSPVETEAVPHLAAYSPPGFESAVPKGTAGGITFGQPEKSLSQQLAQATGRRDATGGRPVMLRRSIGSEPLLGLPREVRVVWARHAQFF